MSVLGVALSIRCTSVEPVRHPDPSTKIGESWSAGPGRPVDSRRHAAPTDADGASRSSARLTSWRDTRVHVPPAAPAGSLFLIDPDSPRVLAAHRSPAPPRLHAKNTREKNTRQPLPAIRVFSRPPQWGVAPAASRWLRLGAGPPTVEKQQIVIGEPQGVTGCLGVRRGGLAHSSPAATVRLRTARIFARAAAAA